METEQYLLSHADAVDALMGGRKLRQKSWKDGVYIRRVDGVVVDVDGYPIGYSLDEFLELRWYLVPEYVDFTTAMKHVFAGGKARPARTALVWLEPVWHDKDAHPFTFSRKLFEAKWELA